MLAFNQQAVRYLYRLLKHEGYWSQLHCQDIENNRLIARELVKGEENVLKFARQYNGQGNIFLGRNPRQANGDIAATTCLTFDIDPQNYERQVGSTRDQLGKCIDAGKAILAAYPGGWLALTGNGVLVLFVSLEYAQTNPLNFASAFRDFSRTKIEPIVAQFPEVKLDPLYDSERLIKLIGTISCRGAKRITRFLGVQNKSGDSRNIFSAVGSLLLQSPAICGPQPGDICSQEGRIGSSSGSGSPQGPCIRNTARNVEIKNVSPRIPHGARHNFLVHIGGSLRRNGLGETAIYEGIKAAFKDRCDPNPAPTDQAFRNIARSMMRYEPQEVLNGTLAKLAVELDPVGIDRVRVILRNPANSLEDYKSRIVQRGAYTSPELAFGFPELDKATWGLRRGEIFTVAARTGVGKTSFCINVAHSLLKAGKKVLFLSTEMNYAQIFDRLISVATGLLGETLQTGNLDANSKDLFVQGCKQLEGFGFSVFDGFEPNFTQVEEALKESQADVLIFDHIQHAAQGQDTMRTLSNLIKGLKQLALMNKIAVIVVSQVSRPLRSVDQQSKALVSSRLNLFELKGSGDIENESAMVLLLHPTENNLDENTIVLDLELAKNRFGSTLYTSLVFDRSCTRFRPLIGETK